MRVEHDSQGAVDVPEDRYWGAQTERARRHFQAGAEPVPPELIHAYGLLKKVAALVNRDLARLDPECARLIVQAAEEVESGALDAHFPLMVWVSGSGTQVNMNVNEVIANRAIEIAGGIMGSRHPVHPNDHVNMSQSSNDTFPTAMNVAAAIAVRDRLTPGLDTLRASLAAKVEAWEGIIKIGRTHLQDAVPMTLGQEFSGYQALLDQGARRLAAVQDEILALALGGTAIGTGLNTHPEFGVRAAARLAELTGLPFVSAENKFAAQGSHDAVVALSGTLRTLAQSLYKIANDIRLLSCGPRCGLFELELPANEPGSSIMPGKVNPTQTESLAMIAIQVMANDVAIGFGGASGQLEMNVYKPLIAHNVLQSIRLLGDGCRNFAVHLVDGMRPNLKRIRGYVDRSLMLVTALAPIIGYDRAAAVAHHAFAHDQTLKEACVELGVIDAETFEALVDPKAMLRPGFSALDP